MREQKAGNVNAIIEKNLGAIVIAAAIVLAVGIYAFATRYQPVPAGGIAFPLILDRWTGKTIPAGPGA
jgi:hypothetical protein